MLDRRDLLKLGAAATVGTGLAAGRSGAQDDETPTETPTGTEATPQAPPEGELYAAARLTGAAQAPEPVETNATGAATFVETDEGLAYELYAATIENVTMAHIHVGGPDEAGPVTQWLYPGADATEPEPIEGEFAGLLAADTITGENLTGPLEGESLDALVSEMEAGTTYVNVHTEENEAGEIRGQIRLVEGEPTTETPEETATPEETPDETATDGETPTPEETGTPTPDDGTPTPEETPTPEGTPTPEE